MAMRDSLRSLAAAGIIDIRVGLKGGIFVAQGNAERIAETLAIQIKLIGVDKKEIFDSQIAIEVTAAGPSRQSMQRNRRLKVSRLMSKTCNAISRCPTPSRPPLSTSIRWWLPRLTDRVLIAQFRALQYVLTPLLASLTTPTIALRTLASHKALIACIERAIRMPHASCCIAAWKSCETGT